MRQALTTLVFLMPPSNLKNRLLNLLGHQVHPKARIGITLVRRVLRFELEEGALIGHFNVFRDLALVRVGYGSRIFMFNQVLGDSGYEGGPDDGQRRTIKLGPHCHIISQHYLDCGAGIVLEENSWVTGIRSTLLTHAFHPTEGGIVLEPIVFKKGAVAATSCTLLPGTVVGEGALLAAGSTTWTGQDVAAEYLHGGVPARRLSPIKIPAFVYNRARYIP